MIEIRTLQYNDIFDIETREEDKERFIYQSYDEWWAIIEKSDAYTILYNNEILWCGGICIYQKWIGEAWILCSKIANNYPIITFRTTKKILDKIINIRNLPRTQAVSRNNCERDQRFLECLGFQREGKLRKYGPDGNDYYMYSRIK